MQLAAHEAHDLHELTLSCVNSITNMALFLNQVKDPQLKSLIEKHFPYHIKDYNTKVEYLSRTSGAKTGLPVPEMTKIIDNFTQSKTNAKSITPRTDVQQLDDREIATAYLLTLKRAGREYAWAAMEASNPEIRTFLEDAFKMSSHHAYDVWQWMVSKGYYPLEAAPAETLGTIASIYKAVPESSAVIQ
ncbi:spore coat protein [Pseudobacteroides cellulosolvens]|uniref:Coat F domain protein n=1 Tax=Pseudobacteroides cellulosolvens ATCC 35603 = DSM 2933 TaxID=398512 RepID=A0A0L6JU99_9FIRM|nr:spore coat protein [Pseudobacteroides cellulosolvens]KNY29294.1 Coat F domain protein [Pseudobacteroides cellulosolvens ATCC 35603 = DSM 2933]